MQTNERSLRLEIEEIRAKNRLKLAQYRFVLVFVLSLMALVLAFVPVGAMYASQLDLLADTGLDGVTNRDIVDALWPVNSIYLSIDAANPGEAGGVFENTDTEWEAWGAGRTPVGYLIGDADFGTAGGTGGAKTATLTQNQLPSGVTGEVNLGGAGSAVSGQDGTLLGSTRYTGSGTTHHSNGGNDWAKLKFDLGGKGDGHNNLQPYIVCFMWKRIA